MKISSYRLTYINDHTDHVFKSHPKNMSEILKWFAILNGFEHFKTILRTYQSSNSMLKINIFMKLNLDIEIKLWKWKSYTKKKTENLPKLIFIVIDKRAISIRCTLIKSNQSKSSLAFFSGRIFITLVVIFFRSWLICVIGLIWLRSFCSYIR